MGKAAALVAQRAWSVPLAVIHAFGYLAFALAVVALSTATALLGERHELGYFAGRLSGAIRRYPEITRRGVRMAWVCWALLLIVALTDSEWWDEIILLAVAVAVVARRIFYGSSGR